MALEPRVKLVSCKSAFNLPMVCSTDPSKVVVLLLVLLFCCFVVYSTRRFLLSLALCYFVLVFFSPFSIAITSLGEDRANLSAFRTFVQFALVWFCLFPLPFGCLGRAVACDCSTLCTFLLPFFSVQQKQNKSCLDDDKLLYNYPSWYWSFFNKNWCKRVHFFKLWCTGLSSFTA